ncbi:MAG: transcriptional regulator, TetR family [Frankiales bacterium]|nr:transcriptional regulator, TetR family [Frankiales bacterium]
MTAAQDLRARARADLVAAIKASAATQLASVGAAALSLRAVARDLGLASSALYRYFPSRDALLTALIVDAYDAVGAVAEQAEDAARTRGGSPGERWLAVCRAVRGWAVAHPHEYALVYGSPVPGYAAPADTVEPAVRLSRVMARVLLDAAGEGTLRVPARPLPGPRLVTPAVLEVVGGAPGAPYEDLLERSFVLLTALVGTTSYLLFGHLKEVLTDDDAWFDVAMAVAAEGVGLDLPLGPRTV